MTHPPTDFRALCAEAVDFLMKISEKLTTPNDLNDADQLEFRLRDAALSAEPQFVEFTTSVCGRKVIQVEAGSPPSEYVPTGQAEPLPGGPAMTWHSALLPDDALDPTSLVGRLLNPSTKGDDLVKDLAKSAEPLPGFTAQS
jgi:hypothetical protein